MKYYTYVEPSEHGDALYVTKSEKEILEEYYPHWYARMAQKHGYITATFLFSEKDCIEDWVITNWAWES